MTTFQRFFTQKRGEIRKNRKSIEDVLKAGPATVSTLSEKTKMPKDLLVWNLMGMMKWGIVDVVGEENHELVYSLKEA